MLFSCSFLPAFPGKVSISLKNVPQDKHASTELRGKHKSSRQPETGFSYDPGHLLQICNSTSIFFKCDSVLEQANICQFSRWLFTNKEIELVKM